MRSVLIRDQFHAFFQSLLLLSSIAHLYLSYFTVLTKFLPQISNVPIKAVPIINPIPMSFTSIKELVNDTRDRTLIRNRSPRLLPGLQNLYSPVRIWMAPRTHWFVYVRRHSSVDFCLLRPLPKIRRKNKKACRTYGVTCFASVITPIRNFQHLHFSAAHVLAFILRLNHTMS